MSFLCGRRNVGPCMSIKICNFIALLLNSSTYVMHFFFKYITNCLKRDEANGDKKYCIIRKITYHYNYFQFNYIKYCYKYSIITCKSCSIFEINTQLIRPTDNLNVPCDITSSRFVSISEHTYNFGVCLTYFISKTLSSSVVNIFKQIYISHNQYKII